MQQFPNSAGGEGADAEFEEGGGGGGWGGGGGGDTYCY